MSKRIEDAYAKDLDRLITEYWKEVMLRLFGRELEIAPPARIDVAITSQQLTQISNMILGLYGGKVVKEHTIITYLQGLNFANYQHGEKVTNFLSSPQDQRAIDALTEKGVLNLKGVLDESNKRIMNEVVDGLQRGEGYDKIARRIREIEPMSRSRAEMIARTETMYAVNTANIQRLKSLGFVRGKWLAGIDSRTCQSCINEDGNEYDLDSFPAIPKHPRCRCTVQGVA